MTNATSRDQSIVFQNSMGHATQIMMHNAKVGGKHEAIDPKEVIRLAKSIALVALNPDLEGFLRKMQEEKGK